MKGKLVVHTSNNNNNCTQCPCVQKLLQDLVVKKWVLKLLGKNLNHPVNVAGYGFIRTSIMYQKQIKYRMHQLSFFTFTKFFVIPQQKCINSLFSRFQKCINKYTLHWKKVLLFLTRPLTLDKLTPTNIHIRYQRSTRYWVIIMTILG